MADYKQETGRTLSKTQDIIISKNSKEISNPEEVAELFNSYFSKISRETVKQKWTQHTIIRRLPV